MTKLIKIVFITLVFFLASTNFIKADEDRFWEIQSIDTMKYSRDLAREKANDKHFEALIDEQLGQISETGATHVAIGTPYDEEFLPYLKAWISFARKNNLKVWFRGNLSGWEGWFNYSLITKEDHTQKIVQFIKDNPKLFEDGDIFSSCPECENGAIGDPRSEVSVEEFRRFIVDEYTVVKESFNEIEKDVKANFYSMNADVAYLVMDEETTNALDGLVTVDHYVRDADSYLLDIERLASRSGGKIMIGEFGAPIPDIHGYMNESEQSKWIDSSLSGMVNDAVVGVNYWTHTSSSTGIWTEFGRARPAVSIIGRFYQPKKIEVKVENELGKAIKNARARLNVKTFTVNEEGNISVLTYDNDLAVNIVADGYEIQTFDNGSLSEGQVVILIKENIFFKIGKFFVRLFSD